MPVTPTSPGVYIEKIPSGVRTITGVATSITAFIGRALLGPADGTGETEVYDNVSVEESPRQVNKVLKDSRLIRWNETKKLVQDIKNITVTHLIDYADMRNKWESATSADTETTRKAVETAGLLRMDPVSQKEATVKTAQAALDAALLDPTRTDEQKQALMSMT